MARPDFTESLDAIKRAFRGVIHEPDAAVLAELSRAYAGGMERAATIAQGLADDQRFTGNILGAVALGKVAAAIRGSPRSVSLSDLACRYGVSKSTVLRIVQGKRWRHLTPEGPK